MIILNKKDHGILSITLYDILKEIEDMDNFNWKLLWIEGVSRDFNIGSLERSVNKTKEGLIIDSKRLLEISLFVDQLYELVLIGYKDESILYDIDKEDELKNEYEFFIELIDSSYWEIYSKNEKFIEILKRLYISVD